MWTGGRAGCRGTPRAGTQVTRGHADSGLSLFCKEAGHLCRARTLPCEREGSGWPSRHFPSARTHLWGKPRAHKPLGVSLILHGCGPPLQSSQFRWRLWHEGLTRLLGLRSTTTTATIAPAIADRSEGGEVPMVMVPGPSSFEQSAKKCCFSFLSTRSLVSASAGAICILLPALVRGPER